MPRLTNNDYLAQRDIIRSIWIDHRGAFTKLTYDQQMELVGYYAPHEDFSPEEAILHRKLVTADHPSLPHRAGKLYQRLQDYVRQAQQQRGQARPPVPNARRDRGQLQVSALARPVPDFKKMAKAMMQVARELERDGG